NRRLLHDVVSCIHGQRSAATRGVYEDGKKSISLLPLPPPSTRMAWLLSSGFVSLRHNRGIHGHHTCNRTSLSAHFPTRALCSDYHRGHAYSGERVEDFADLIWRRDEGREVREVAPACVVGVG
ncbi:unnamed protein product, partial [Hapterophycus canaliculatus]